MAAFQTNNLTSVILPDTVTSLGGGAFGTNPKIERISISKGLTEIPAGAFGCSDAKNWMENLKNIEIPEGITKIGSNAFAGNNFSEIVIPSSVKEISSFAFSTKNYLSTPCTVTLNEGLETIGADAFRNKVISEITLPTTVTKINKNTFRKEYSDGTAPVITKVYVSLKSQYEDTKNFPASDFHKLYLTDTSVWTAEDFTYGEMKIALYPAGEYSTAPNFDLWVVTGLSEYGSEKLENNKDLVIPVTDPDGKKVQGVGNSAFYKKGITTLSLPENVKVAYDDSTWKTTGKGLTERGDFFIGASAFQGNNLTTLELPDGVIYVGGNAFNSNRLTSVKLPKSVMMIGNAAFGKNSISSLEIPEETDFAFQADNMAFAINKITSVQIPSNTEKMHKWAFLQNTGMEPVVDGTTAEKKGGIVYMYKTTEGGAWIDHVGNGKSNVQKLMIGTIPSKQAPWGVNDFTYDEAGITITGLSDAGKEKIKTNPALILPKEGPSGEAVTALGDGKNMTGIFVYSEGDKNYTPASVLLPDTLTKIGKWTFALNAGLSYEADMTAIALPEGLQEIGQTAFQNSKLTSVSIPDSVTTMGSGTFTGSANLTSVRLSKNVTDIPASAFNAGTSTDMKLKTLVIPEGVKTIGTSAFTGTHIESLTLPDTLTSIGNNAFQNHQLTEVVIPGSVKTIGSSAFKITQEGLTKALAKVTLNEGLVTIGKEAFMGNKITEIDLPSTATLSHVNKSADCIFGSSKTTADPIVIVKVADKSKEELFNTEYANKYSHTVVYDKLVGSGWTADDFTYDEAKGMLTGWSESGDANRTNVKTLVLPDKTPDGKDIVAIADRAFKIPDDEVIITKFGIDSPNGLTSVVLPAKLKTIGKEAFAQNALTEVDFNGIQSIGERAFYGNDLVKVELPDSVTELGDGAFSTNDITGLRLSAGITRIPSGAFSMNIRLSNITIPDTVTEIGDTAFAGARLTSLTIPESVEKIGRKAFHLHHLSELVIPGNVKEIGESAFEGTYKATTLRSLIIEEGVKSIGKFAFKEALLETVHFPESIVSVGEKPFMNNKGKDGSHVVEVTTTNQAHLTLEDETYVVKYVGTYEISDYENEAGLSFETIVYTGNPIKPQVTIEGLKEGTDFTVEYQNNTNIGTATVVIHGIGNYTGTITKHFTITAPAEQPGDSGASGDNQGTVEVKDDVIKDAIANTTQNNVVISLKDSAEPVKQVELQGKSLEAVATADKSLTIETKKAAVTFDKVALVAIAKQAGTGNVITLAVEEIEADTLNAEQKKAINEKDVMAILSVEILCNGNSISNFNGGIATVQIPFTPEAGTKGEDYVVAYVADDGTVEYISTDYVDGHLVVELKHFSKYVIMKAEGKLGASKPNTSPQTGDSTSIRFMVAMMLMEVTCLVFCAKRRMGKNDE